ncbi:transglutaminase family protein [Agromyces atrinae]|uniref:Transglutaminase family protein n=1 Tax=Agromyces atrinae TaxID=592376 RepID=A0A4Q2M7P1_9MICO|nr:transglutaminase family protein [Agromyces atrinae]NYD67506.1 transglutaminase-like putative cysteine protease [Agromyces atrinae]RXZ88275.1 transglutaminase family protein [Agromyces atrinae]
MSRLRIVHRTGFSYAEPATASYNEARMSPYSQDEQFVLSSSLEIHPTATQHSYLDYWGTRVSTFEVLTPHRELSVTATSVVEVRPIPRSIGDIEWDTLDVVRESATIFVEQARQTRATDPDEDVVALARDIRSRGGSVAEVALEVCRTIGEAMQYVPGSTGVHTTSREAWAEKRGVCQDIAHVSIGALRAIGIPARYVSGYLHPRPSAAIGETVTGESHAWVEWFSGDWRGYDPTNQQEIGENHVLVARGRDYSDVSPLRGVYAGQSGSTLFVTVEITREA